MKLGTHTVVTVEDIILSRGAFNELTQHTYPENELIRLTVHKNEVGTTYQIKESQAILKAAFEYAKRLGIEDDTIDIWIQYRRRNEASENPETCCEYPA